MDSGGNWQTKFSSVRERNFHAFNNSFFTDIEFSVKDSNGKTVSVKANKYVLAISSPVFEAMFYGKLAETGRTIDLPDCTKEGLEELFRYMYSDEVHLDNNNILEMMRLAEYFHMPFLVKKCEEHLKRHAGPDDVFAVLPLVSLLQNENIEELCWRIIDHDTQKAIISESFFCIPRDTLRKLLERESLFIKEFELFQAVDRWAQKRIDEGSGVSKRDALGEEVFQLIRFPVIMRTQRDFEFVISQKILLEDEITELENYRSDPRSGTHFKKLPRKGKMSWTITRFKSFELYTCTNEFECVDIQVSKPVQIAGVRLFGNEHCKYQMKITIEEMILGQDFSRLIFETADDATYITRKEKFHDKTKDDTESDEETEGYYGLEILFGDTVRVQLQSNAIYTFRAHYVDKNREPYFYGYDGESQQTVHDITIRFMEDENQLSSHSSKSGQFPSLLMNFQKD